MAGHETNADNITEKDLVERLKKRQKWAFDHLVLLYQGRLFKLAYGITLSREDSLEVVQDVFISVFNHIQTFRHDSSLSTWMRKITIHHCLNWKRKWKRRFRWNHRSIEDETDFDQFKENTNFNDPEILFNEKEMEGSLMKAIRNLPEKNRLVFVLNAIEGLSYDEIAQTLKINKSTVGSRLYLARQSLIDSLALNEKKRISYGKQV